MAPRGIPCPLCGKQFFKASLPIHQKSCRKRTAEQIDACPYCELEMPRSCLTGHVKTCKQARRAKGSRSSSGSLAPLGPAAFTSRTLPDGRVTCEYCSRGFSGDRIHIHTRVCSRLKQARPKGPDGRASQVVARVYNAQVARENIGNIGRKSNWCHRSALPTPSPTRKVAWLVDPQVWRKKHQQWIQSCGGDPKRARVRPVPVRGARPSSTPAARGLARHPGLAQGRAPLHRTFPARGPTQGSLRSPADGKALGVGAAGLAPGAWVKLGGLNAAAFNGTRGQIIQLSGDGRWEVDVQGSRKALKPANLEPELREGLRVKLHGLNSKPLNGLTGELLKFDSAGGRWHVSLPQGPKAIKPDHIALARPGSAPRR